MKQLPDNFKSASFLMCGAASALIALNVFIPYHEPPVIPGFCYLLGICWPIFFLWAGMLLRRRWPSFRWWIQLPILAVALFCLYLYIHNEWATYRDLPYLYIAVFGAGFLIHPESLEKKGQENGWVPLAFLLVSVFCYTAVVVIQNRVRATQPFATQFEDMETLFRWLLNTAEPLILFIALYFVTCFSFSKNGLWLGGRKWFRIAAAVCIALVFLGQLFGSLAQRFHFSLFGCWTDILRFLVLPATIYLLVIIVRATKKIFKKGEMTEIAWKDVYKI